MTHLEYLVDVLRPMGIYDLRPGRVNRVELEAYAKMLDEGLDELETTAREMLLATAEDFGLDMIEELLPYRPASPSAQERREALAALLRIGGDSFTLDEVNATLAGCGITARARETDQPGYVEVYFPGVIGIPEEFDRVQAIVEEILPCHLDVTYMVWYLTWAELAEKVSTWGAAVNTGKTWYQLATWIE